MDNYKEMRAYQCRVAKWLQDCFGIDTASNLQERSMRFLEEALELCQAMNLSQTDALKVVLYVYNRPKGEPAQEVGGVMVTLASLCQSTGIDLQEAARVELERICAPDMIEKMRTKQDFKRSQGLTFDSEKKEKSYWEEAGIKPPEKCTGKCKMTSAVGILSCSTCGWDDY